MDKQKSVPRRMLFSAVADGKMLSLFVIASSILLLLLFSRQGAETLEERLSGALSQLEGAGSVEVVIYQKESENSVAQTTDVFAALTRKSSTFAPSGVLVLAQGADDLRVRLEIERAVQALLDVPASHIEVLKKGD